MPYIYQHAGGTSSITTSFSSPGDNPSGLSWDGSNLWSCDEDASKIYQHIVGTGSITTSFASPGSSPFGLAWDSSGNLWSCDSTVSTEGDIYKHSGGTSTVADSYYPHGGLTHGLAWEPAAVDFVPRIIM